MTQEEKAKRYDQAIKVAKSKIKNDKEHVLYEDDIIEIFPEIVELTWEDIDTMALEYVKKSNPTLSKIITKESLRASYYLRGDYDTYRQGLIDMYNKIKK